MAAQTWLQLHLTHTAAWKAFEQGLTSVGVTLPQAMALRAIQDGPQPMTLRRLAQHLHHQPQSVSGLVQRMEHQGWVHRVRDLADRRAIRLELTAAGAEKLRETQPIGALLTEQVFGNLTTDELYDLTALLGKLYLTMRDSLPVPNGTSVDQQPVDLETWRAEHAGDEPEDSHPC